MNLLGAVLSVLLVASPPPTSGDWSLTPIPGSALSPASGLATATLAPGASVSGTFRIVHTAAIDGPVDVSATTTDPVSAFEDQLLVTASLNGHAGPTSTLGSLLRGSATARAGILLPDGPATLTVSIKLDPRVAASEALDSAAFTLFVTVSNEIVILPGQSADPGSGSASGSGRGSPGLASILAPTGTAISAAMIAGGIALLLLGVLLLLRRRRRSVESADAQRSP